MSQRLTTKSRPDYEYTTASTTTTQIICSYNDAFEAVIRRFRFLVPEVDVSHIRAATNACDVKRAIEDTGSPSGFVLFADYNHAGWMRHFTTPEAPVRRAQRFTFGNPLYALPILQCDIEAALHIPLDCCFIEEIEGSMTKLIVTLPAESGSDDDAMRQALANLGAKLTVLVQLLAPQSFMRGLI